MTGMKVRARVPDLIVLAGLAVLVAWTPVYFAQSAEERQTLDGDRFLLPDLRYGDSLTFELVVSPVGGQAETSGAIMEVVYLAPPPDAHPSVTLVERRTTELAHVAFKLGVLQMNTAVTEIHYDADMRVVWHGSTRAYGLGDGSEATRFAVHESHRSDHDPRRSLFLTGLLWMDREEELWYKRAAPVESIFRFYELPARPPDSGGEPGAYGWGIALPPSAADQYRVQAIHEHRGRLLHAALVSQEPNRGSPMTQAAFAGYLGVGASVHLDEGLDVHAYRTWHWYARDVPVIAGYHRELLDANDQPLLALDFVLASFERGSEPIASTEPMPSLTPGPSSLREWGNDTGTVGHVSPAAILEALSGADAPEVVRNALIQGGWLAGLRMQGDFVALDAGFHSLDWRAVIVDADQKTHLVAFATTPQGEIVDVTVTPHECGSSVGTVGGDGLRVLCADSIAGDAATDGWVNPSTLAEKALAELVSSMEESRVPSASVTMTFGPIFGSLGVGHSSPGKFPGALRVDATADALTWMFTLRSQDGALLSFMHANEEASDVVLAAALDPMAAAEAAPLRRVDVLGPDAAIGGLLLVFVGILLRALAAMKSGAHVPLLAALYAKIAKDKALDNERRATLAALVEQDPGVSLMLASTRSGLHRTVAFHHLDTLRRNEVIREVRLGRTRHYVPRTLGRREAVRIAVMRHEPWNTVLQTIEAFPGLDVTEIARRLGRHKSGVSRVGRLLAGFGVVERDDAGAQVRYRPVPVTDPAPSFPAAP